LHFADLLDAGCPVGRHELTDEEWKYMPLIRAEKAKWQEDKKK